MQEEWKDIKFEQNGTLYDYTGLYLVSNMGRVKSLDRTDSLGRYIKGKILKKNYDGRYETVTLSKNGKTQTLRVHRLVGNAFIPNPKKLPEINHIDECRKNNTVQNLEWCDSYYNNHHGTKQQRAKEYYEKKSKKVCCYNKNGVLIKQYKSVREAANDIGCKNVKATIVGINRCINKKSTTSYGYKWKYDDNKYKFFIISDPHGCFQEMINALIKSGYNETNPSHKLVCLGDFTDRGTQVLEIYKYLKRLTDENKAIVLGGNHSLFLIDFLEGSASPFNYLNNGLNETIDSFLGRTRAFESWCLLDKGIEQPTNIDFYEWSEVARKEINEEYPELLTWLKSRPKYFESEHYIGVHGAIDTKVENWHNPHCYHYQLTDWDALDFNDGSFFDESITNTDKTIIIGHFGTRFLRKMYSYEIKEGHEDDILYRDDGKVIAIDATTIASKKINVLVIEDELLEEQ